MIYTLNKLTVSFNFALTVAQIMVEAQTALDKLRVWLFLMLETFLVFLGHMVFNMLFL